MEFFATGAFQQLYSELDDECGGVGGGGGVCSDLILTASADVLAGGFRLRQCCHGADWPAVRPAASGHRILRHHHLGQQQQPKQQPSSDYDYDYDYIGHAPYAAEEHGLFFDFSDQELSGCSTSTCTTGSRASPELSEWEQRLLDHFVEIPELIDFLPERTPLCTDMCDDFLEESNSNLRLAAPVSCHCHSTAASPAASPGSTATDTAAVPQLSQNAAGERGYLCTFGNCEKLYAKPAHLKAHLRRHLGEKPYACSWPECTWRFSRSDELARHRRSHSGIKPYKCDYCAKCFARSDHLTKHRKVHERRLQAATRLGKLLPADVYAVRPGRKRKNQL
ncbi:LOW QUALITY PROTEIN: transcription factor Sp8 [Drosophila obscura]|uniref:LOW QUALITY PROTEIN: transcription factor Sp8 n=1 Tax=Drosophila obscura TaxID=7282 RepID=UPI001BB2658F|nr:LOW QUALITY PROTEIN: transcription factor Sp8 [Drosophila obscura]